MRISAGATSWRITYLYDEYGKPYAGVYRSPASSTSPVVFALVTTDRGDVVGLLDAEGSPFAAYRYDAWGNPQGSGDVATGLWSQATNLISSQLASDIARPQPLRYASYCYDTESGLYYLSARSYDPKTRQFLSKDLSRSDGEQSAYQYCGGNPVRYVDPTGYRVDDDGCRAAQIRYYRALAALYQRVYATIIETSKKAVATTLKKRNKTAVASADVDQRIGRMPPSPPGYDKKTWEVKKYGDKRYLLDPEGNQWMPHRGDARHWPHWDWGPEGGNEYQRYPPSSLKPRPGKEPKPGESVDNPWPEDVRGQEWNWAVPYMLTPEEMPIIMPGPGPVAAEAAPVVIRFIWRAITALF